MFFRKKPEGVEHPESIQIETTNRCNARCTFCHHPRMKRPPTDMPDALFARLVGDLRELQPKEVHPFVNGEPLMDRQIFERLAMVNEALPHTGIHIFTNGALLDEVKAERLAAVRNLRVINFSLNSCDAEDYKKRVGPDFHRTVRNIEYVLRLNRERPFVGRIEISSVEYGKEDPAVNKRYNDAFRKFCEERFPGAGIKIGYKYNYISRIFSFRRFRDIRCPRLRGMTVLANGLVSLCCMDMEGEYILGNANERSLLDIYNGALAREYRQNRKSRMVPCRWCNMI